VAVECGRAVATHSDHEDTNSLCNIQSSKPQLDEVYFIYKIMYKDM